MIGEVEIEGFILRFKGSPIGVKKIELEIDEDKLYTTINTGYKLSSADKLFEKSFNIAKETAQLFVVKK